MANKGVQKAKAAGARPDFATLGGVLLAMGGIVGGLLLEGGAITDILQYTAAIIVLGGTIGAVMINTPGAVLAGALRKLPWVFLDRKRSASAVVDEIITYATKARKNGIISLENDLDAIDDPFLRKGLSLAVDGTDLQDIRKMLELEIMVEEKSGEAEAKVFETAGGYAPTIGIIGAVLGLIQVMKNLENIEEVGHGIAVAFVATVYGVGVANLFFLPAASKIKARIHHNIDMKEMVLEGVSAIVEGLNPKLIRTKLEAFAHAGEPAASKKGGKEPTKAAQPASAVG